MSVNKKFAHSTADKKMHKYTAVVIFTLAHRIMITYTHDNNNIYTDTSTPCIHTQDRLHAHEKHTYTRNNNDNIHTDIS